MELQPTLDVLCRCYQRATGTWTLEQGCSAVVHAAREATGCRSAAVLMLTGGDSCLKVVAHRGLTDHFAYHYRPDLAENGTLDRVVRREEMIVVPDAPAEPEQAADLKLEHDAGAVVAVPVRSAGVGLGALVCEWERPGAIPEGAPALLKLLGYMTGSWYDRCTLRRQQRHLTLTDAETGAYSLEFFCARLKEEMRRADRTGRGLGVLAIQVDHLRRYDQSHGSREATVALSQIVGLVQARLRPLDTVARYSPNELVIFLPETKEEGLLKAADRLRRAVDEHAFAHADPHLTLSLGAAVYAEEDDLSDLMERSQKALYRAQLEGGDRASAAWEA